MPFTVHAFQILLNDTTVDPPCFFGCNYEYSSGEVLNETIENSNLRVRQQL
jgi:hypothetical protein